MKIILLAAVLGAASSLQAQQASTDTYQERMISLDDAFALALKRSEQIAQDAETVKQALARVSELRGAILPHVALVASETLQESPNTSIPAFNNTSIPLAQITMTQPLFSGFREFLAFKAGRKQAEIARLTERRAEDLLYQDVAQAYLNLLQLEDEIDIRGSIVTATDERIGQLGHWVNIGRSRESEVLAARSQLAQTQAQVEIARGQEAVAQELLRFLTGLEDVRFIPRPVAEPSLEPLGPYLTRARQRDDVEASRRNLDASRFSTEIARRQRWPTIGLTADYYLRRVGIQNNIHYDAIFGFNLPLFDGGQISAQVREAKAQENAAAQALSWASRGAERDVRSAYRGLEWSLASARALAKAADLAERNVKAQEQDYRLSLVTNLDVLDSLNTLETTRLQLNSAQQQAALARVQLEVAAGMQRAPNGSNP